MRMKIAIKRANENQDRIFAYIIYTSIFVCLPCQSLGSGGAKFLVPYHDIGKIAVENWFYLPAAYTLGWEAKVI